MSALLLALTAISLATQQTIGLNRLCSCENGLLKIRHLLGEKNPSYECHSARPYVGRYQKSAEDRVRMKKSQLWIWQTPVMLSNFAILLFIIGLMISVFHRAAASRGDWSTGHIQVLPFFIAIVKLLERTTDLFIVGCHLLRLCSDLCWNKLSCLLALLKQRIP